MALNTLTLFKVSRFGRNTFRSLKTTRLSRENLPVVQFTPHSPVRSSDFRNWSCEGILSILHGRASHPSFWIQQVCLKLLLPSMESHSPYWVRTPWYPFQIPTHLWREAGRGRRCHEYGDQRFLGLLVPGRNAVIMDATPSPREVRKWEK